MNIKKLNEALSGLRAGVLTEENYSFEDKDEQKQALADFINDTARWKEEYQTGHEDAGNNYLELLEPHELDDYLQRGHGEDLYDVIKKHLDRGVPKKQIWDKMMEIVEPVSAGMGRVNNAITQFPVGEIEDQITGIYGTVNGKTVNDVYAALADGLDDDDLEYVAKDVNGGYWEAGSDYVYIDSNNASWAMVVDPDDLDKLLLKIKTKGKVGESWGDVGKLAMAAGKLGLHLMKNPAGTFSFRGSVPVKLGYLNKDGSMLSDEQAKDVARSGSPGLISKTRVFKNVKDALSAAKELGIKEKDIQILDNENAPIKEQAKFSPRDVKDILIALNSTGGSMGFKYPIGNKELTQKVKDMEAQGLISYDDKFDKWKKESVEVKGSLVREAAGDYQPFLEKIIKCLDDAETALVAMLDKTSGDEDNTVSPKEINLMRQTEYLVKRISQLIKDGTN